MGYKKYHHAKFGGNRTMHVDRKKSDVFTFLTVLLRNVIAIGWTSVRPSVTRWYSVEMVKPIVKLSYCHDSSFMRIKLFPKIPMETPPMGALNARGRKSCNFRQIVP